MAKTLMDIEIKENDLRQYMVDNPEKVKDLLLTKRQIEIIKATAKLGQMTSESLAVVLDISVQNASAQLGKLRFKGYLSRTYTASNSGGIIYVYFTDYQ
jgi:DNA-binding CsgD family transcriptional regulator